MRPKSVDIETFKKEYRAYHDAKQRCTNPNHKRYADWGGRGIEFRFNSFQAFLAFIGPAPENSSLDRIDNNGHYEVYNIKWSTRSQQQHNKRVRKANKFGMTGVRQVSAKGLQTPTYQAYVHKDGVFNQLYCGPSLDEAKAARGAHV